MRFFLLFTVLAALLPAVPARAQLTCDAVFEAIVTLHPPRLGVPTVWDATYGQKDKMVQFASGVPVAGGTVMTLGRTIARDSFRPEEIFLAEINRRGRVLKEKMYPAKEAEQPVRLIAAGKDYVAVSNVRGGAGKARHHVRLSWYGADGAFRRDKILQDDTYDYDVTDMAGAADGSGFVVVMHAVNKGDAGDQHGIIIRFDSGGGQIWKRAYRPGIPNEISGVSAVEGQGKGYITAGRIRLDDGRMAGWVMKLGSDGTVLWQRTYPRGKFSVLRRGAAMPAANGYEGGGYFLLGESTPLDDGPDAAWLLALDGLGEPQWQRYFRMPDFSFSSFGLMRNEDGRLIVALGAKAAEGTGHRDHVRMLILSPRGEIVEDESYIEGIQAHASDFVRGWNGERIVTATIESDSKPLEDDMIDDDFIVAKAVDAGDAAEKKEVVSKGWVFVGTALDPYADPCGLRRGR